MQELTLAAAAQGCLAGQVQRAARSSPAAGVRAQSAGMPAAGSPPGWRNGPRRLCPSARVGLHTTGCVSVEARSLVCHLRCVAGLCVLCAECWQACCCVSSWLAKWSQKALSVSLSGAAHKVSKWCKRPVQGSTELQGVEVVKLSCARLD